METTQVRLGKNSGTTYSQENGKNSGTTYSQEIGKNSGMTYSQENEKKLRYDLVKRMESQIIQKFF